MSEFDANPRAVMGGNNPVVEELFRELNDELPKRLEQDCGDVITRAKELAKNAETVPTTIENEDQEAIASDIVVQMKKHQKVADSRRLGIGALPRQAQSIINTYFTEGAISVLDKSIARIEPGITKFKRVKAEKERREREEKERLAREEAERQRAAAEAALRAQREAELAKERALAEEKRAKEAAEKAKREAAEAEQRRAEAEQRRADAEVAAAEAESKRKKATLERQAREATEDAAKAEREKKAAEESARMEREKARDAKTDVALAKGYLSDASKEAKTAVSLAKAADGDVDKAARSSNAKLSEVSGVRGPLGSQSSLRTRWVGTVLDRAKLDLNALRDFFTDDDMQKALNKFVSVHKGSRTIKGAMIAEESDTSFR